MRKKYLYREIECPNCKKSVSARFKKCPLCKGILSNVVNQKQKTERNGQIIKELENGEKTLQEIGNEFGVSRERIRQIWKVKNNSGYRIGIKKRGRARIELLEKALSQVKFNCSACGKPVTYREANHKQSLCDYCSDLISNKQKDPKNFVNCEYCRKSIHPYRNKKYLKRKTSAKYFCSREHYIRYISEVGKVRYEAV